MAKKQNNRKFVTKEFTVAFPELDSPTQFTKNSAKPKYRVVALFDKGEDLSELKNEIKQAAINFWGNDVPEDLYIPLKTPEQEKTPDLWPDGTEHAALTTTKVIARDRDHRVSIDPGQFYSGCRARAVIHCWAYEGQGKTPPGISLSLDMIQFVSDGERLGGGTQENEDLLDTAPLKELPKPPVDGKKSGNPLDFLG